MEDPDISATVQLSSQELVGIPFAYDSGLSGSISGDPSSREKESLQVTLNGNTIDFIGSSDALKALWSIPYIQEQTEISVVVHNSGGTLLVDTDGLSTTTSTAHEHDILVEQNAEKLKGRNFITSLSSSSNSQESLPVDYHFHNQPIIDLQQSNKTDMASLLLQTLQQPALTFATSQSNTNNSKETETINRVDTSRDITIADAQKIKSFHNTIRPNDFFTDPMDPPHLPPPEFYTNDIVPTPSNPNQYIPWKFAGLNIVVGSNAIIFPTDSNQFRAGDWNTNGPSNTPEPIHEENNTRGMFTVWFENAQELRSKLQSYEASSPLFLTNSRNDDDKSTPHSSPTKDDEEDNNVSDDKLHSCILASPSTNAVESQLRKLEYEMNLASQNHPDIHGEKGSSTRSSSAVVTVLDAYLDTIIANVPQLALCLYDKGFVQSLHLFNVNEIHQITSDRLDGHVHVHPKNTHPLFSPETVETNASMLLNFLKSHCSQDDSTYLLRKHSGETTIRLYNVSALSQQRRQQWLWWLAMTSYRFAVKLKQLTKSVAEDPVALRSLRTRQRNLLRNALELLEEHADMASKMHGTIVAAIHESLADTYLNTNDDFKEELHDTSAVLSASPRPGSYSNKPLASSFFSEEIVPWLPYRSLRADALTKAQDYLMLAIENLKSMMDHGVSSSNSLGYETNYFLSMQSYGLHHKLINVLLQLTRHHLKNYSSSSAIQSLRMTARRIADAFNNVVQAQNPTEKGKQERHHLTLLKQAFVLWQYCGLFSRSYAADGMWRDRGHVHGDDIVALLQDVQSAMTVVDRALLEYSDGSSKDTSELLGDFDLTNLTGIVKLTALRKNTDSISLLPDAMVLAKDIMDKQKHIKRDERRVLVAATFCFVRAIQVFKIIQLHSQLPTLSQLCLLRQWCGDACNEVGKIVLTEVKALLLSATKVDISCAGSVATPYAPLLLSAESWFMQGLDQFNLCDDKRNIAVIRCNLCQCSKLRANTAFALPRSDLCSYKHEHFSRDNHSEICVQDAINHLQLAHVALDQRDLDTATWDTVSEELAATFLILGVKRRQSILGGESIQVQPGEEKFITQPMEQAVVIYEQLQNLKQAAAAHYQLAIYYSKVWSSQVSEGKTREKLEKAFRHYRHAHDYFFSHLDGNEPTFIILCLDLSQLYSSISSEASCLIKGILCCVDTCDAFLQRPTYSRTSGNQAENSQTDVEKMNILSKTIDENIFKLLVSLVKLEKGQVGRFPILFKDLYRNLLSLKMGIDADMPCSETLEYPVRKLLLRLREEMKVFKNTL